MRLTMLIFAGGLLYGGAALSQTTSPYFPLAPNNQWTFYQVHQTSPFLPPDTSIGLPRAVSQVITLNDSTYFAFDLRITGIDTLRLDHRGNVWKYSAQGDQLLFDFSLPDGANYFYSDPEMPPDPPLIYEVQVRHNETIEVLAGRFDDCIVLGFDDPNWIDEQFTFKFAPNVGVVEWGSAWDHEWLYEARVDNTIISSVDDLDEWNPSPVEVYPNPLRSAGTVQFTLDMPIPITVDLYDVLGRRINSIFGGWGVAGSNTLVLDATTLSPGLYFVRVASPGLHTSHTAIHVL